MLFNSQGFTLVELIMVLVIGGLIAAMAIPRLMGPSPFAARSLADELALALRYTQQLNMNYGTQASLVVTATSFHVERDGSLHPLPWGDSQGSIPSAVILSPSSLTLSFDRLGRPLNSGNSLESPLSLALSGSGGTHTLCVHPDTGYVQIRHGGAGCGAAL